eukprot:TRINITY_DN2697_c0_g1_i1.p1 TRINITY_DN2697_c0_g1~~TRINITY_DN2697_c0_g1_i1.p1  ORF type:complete len:298 (+),score=18.52 TRINITY_DN2697_c0_g1_i1:48-941(+)
MRHTAPFILSIAHLWLYDVRLANSVRNDHQGHRNHESNQTKIVDSYRFAMSSAMTSLSQVTSVAETLAQSSHSLTVIWPSSIVLLVICCVLVYFYYYQSRSSSPQQQTVPVQAYVYETPVAQAHGAQAHGAHSQPIYQVPDYGWTWTGTENQLITPNQSLLAANAQTAGLDQTQPHSIPSVQVHPAAEAQPSPQNQAFVGVAQPVAASQPDAPVQVDPMAQAQTSVQNQAFVGVAQPVVASQPNAVAAGAQPQYLDFKCPRGAWPGSIVEVTLPDGSPHRVEIPAGIQPGMMFSVQV